MFKRIKGKVILFLLLSIVFVACSPGTETSESESQAVDSSEVSEESEEDQESSEEVVEEEKKMEVLPAEPVVVQFEAQDGTQLSGKYFPGSVEESPLIVLLHWAPGDQESVASIAYWLQDRGLQNPLGGGSSDPWLDSSWFPEMTISPGFAVFTFTFRGCEGGCKSFDRSGWLSDLKGAVETAYNLDGIDQTKIYFIGASIGSDGAADGCMIMNENHPNSCQRAFSMSPGDYLTLKYSEVARQLGSESDPKAVWCLFAQGDPESAVVCQALSEVENAKVYEFEGNWHGLMLVQENLSYNTLDLMLEFLSSND